MRTGAVVLAVIAVLAGAPITAAARDRYFKTPGGNIFCQTAGRRLLCGALSTRRPDGAIPVYYLRVHGRARVRPVVGDPDTEVPVLGYGRVERLYRGRIACRSRRRGLTCRSRVSAHGFFLSDRRRFTF